MSSTPTDLERFLEDLALSARPGDRLPPIRDLMRRFGASQMVVQRAFHELKRRGLIASQVGRGTYFMAAGDVAAEADAGGPAPHKDGRAHALAVRSVLLLRRSISIVRGRVLVESLMRRFAAEGHRVLEVSYTDPEHARTVIKALPRFDACVVQSTYKTLTLEALGAVRDKCDVLAMDGTALVGADVEAVGTEWGEPLSVAIERLVQQGHRRIVYVASALPLLANELGRRRFEFLQKTLPGVELTSMTLPNLPDEHYEAALVERIQASVDASGQLPFTAMVVWGIEDGAKFRALLSAIGVQVPSTLSVMLLGRTDLANEHADFFDIVGCSVADQADGLYQAIAARWRDPGLPYGVRLIPVTSRAGQSVAPERGRATRATVSAVRALDAPT